MLALYLKEVSTIVNVVLVQSKMTLSIAENVSAFG